MWRMASKAIVTFARARSISGPVLALALVSAGCAGDPAPTSYELKRVFEVEGRQGIATDGQRYYVSGSSALYAYSKQGRLEASNEDPFRDLDKRANHIGDISVYQGEIYAGIERFESGEAGNIQIAIYDTESLDFRRSIDWDPDSGQVEVSGVAVDPDRSAIWLTDWTNGRYLYRYDLETGSYSGKVHVRPVPQWQQGIAYFDGQLFVTADDGDADEDEVDNLWRVSAEADGTASFIVHEKSFGEFRRAGEIEGLDFDVDARELVVLSNRGKRIVLGMPAGLYPGYDREIHEVYVYSLPGS
jgi:hypothetical protein